MRAGVARQPHDIDRSTLTIRLHSTEVVDYEQLLEYAETIEAFDVIQPGLLRGDAMTELIVDIHKDMWQTANDRTALGTESQAHESRPAPREHDRSIAKTRRPNTMHRDRRRSEYRAADKSRVDVDNAQPTLKAVLDGITDAGAWGDDNSEHRARPYRRGPRSPVKDHYRIHLKFIDQRISILTRRPS